MGADLMAANRMIVERESTAIRTGSEKAYRALTRTCQESSLGNILVTLGVKGQGSMEKRILNSRTMRLTNLQMLLLTDVGMLGLMPRRTFTTTWRIQVPHRTSTSTK